MDFARLRFSFRCSDHISFAALLWTPINVNDNDRLSGVEGTRAGMSSLEGDPVDASDVGA